MYTKFWRMLTATALALVAVSAAVAPVHAFDARAKAAVNTNADKIAIGGYDPVAYFTNNKPVAGSSAFKAAHEGATYQFASAANRDAFVKEPAKFTPQYGGFCAYAASLGYKADVDPTAFKIVDNKLYLNYNHAVNKNWSTDQANYIKKADGKWSSIKDKAPAELR